MIPAVSSIPAAGSNALAGISLPGFFLYILLALSAESMIFSGAGGFSRAMRAARKPGLLHWNTLFVTFFCVCAVCISQILNPWVESFPRPMVARSVIFLCVDALLYLGVAVLMRKAAPSVWKRAGNALSSGALNTLVLSMPFLQQILKMDFLSSLGYALGTGIAFWLASLLLHSALQICSHKDVPRAYRGLPAALLYAGILCLAFCGFSGGRFF